MGRNEVVSRYITTIKANSLCAAADKSYVEINEKLYFYVLLITIKGNDEAPLHSRRSLADKC